MSEPCKFCGVLPEYGHFDWCKVAAAMAALLAGEGVEHVTVWTIDGRSFNRSEFT